jgi:hypothetical protein
MMGCEIFLVQSVADCQRLHTYYVYYVRGPVASDLTTLFVFYPIGRDDIPAS